jgi:hypothetical protein
MAATQTVNSPSNVSEHLTQPRSVAWALHSSHVSKSAHMGCGSSEQLAPVQGATQTQAQVSVQQPCPLQPSRPAQSQEPPWQIPSSQKSPHWLHVTQVTPPLPHTSAVLTWHCPCASQQPFGQLVLSQTHISTGSIHTTLRVQSPISPSIVSRHQVQPSMRWVLHVSQVG